MLRTRLPLTISSIATEDDPLDLHALDTPPAFILSQDQTLRKMVFTNLVDSLVHFINPLRPWLVSEGSINFLPARQCLTGFGPDSICVPPRLSDGIHGHSSVVEDLRVRGLLNHAFGVG